MCSDYRLSKKGTEIPVTGLDRPWGFQKFEATRFKDNRPMKVVRLSAVSIGRLYPQEIFLVLISVRGWVDTRAIVRPEGLWQWRSAVIPSGIEPATFWLLAKCLNQLSHQQRAHVWYMKKVENIAKIKTEILGNEYMVQRTWNGLWWWWLLWWL